MFLRLAHRLLSITLATALTLGMLGGIDHLSQPGTDAAALMAMQARSTQA